MGALLLKVLFKKNLLDTYKDVIFSARVTPSASSQNLLQCEGYRLGHAQPHNTPSKKN